MNLFWWISEIITKCETNKIERNFKIIKNKYNFSIIYIEIIFLVKSLRIVKCLENNYEIKKIYMILK